MACQDSARVFSVQEQRRLRKDFRMLREPRSALRARVVMPGRAEEVDRAAALRLRDLREVFGEADQRGDARGVVVRAFEPPVAMSDDEDRLVGRAGERAPDG